MSFSDRVLGFGAFPNREVADTSLIQQSLMFNDPDTPYLHRTPGSAGNQKTWTWSAWVKRGKIGTDAYLWSVYDGSTSSTYANLYFTGTDTLAYGIWSPNQRVTNRVFRDTAAWYHIMLVLDTTQSTANDRIKIYINGVQETSFSTTNNPSEDSDEPFNAAEKHVFGDTYALDPGGTSRWFDGYLAEVHFIDGTAVAPSAFGETDSDTNQWIPKEYDTASGAYGTNGFYLKFASGALGTDSSGEGNNWTAVNLADTDVTLDTPTNNFCTLNPLSNRSGSTLTQGDLQITGTSTQAHLGGTFNIPATGKWYFEILNQNASYMQCGIIPDAEDRNTSADGNDSELYYDGVGIYSATIRALNSTVTTTTNSAGDIYQMAIDSDTGKVWFGTNNTWVSSGDPSAGSNQIATISDPETWGLTFFAVTSGAIRVLNCGQNSSFAANKTAQNNADANGVGDFYYAPPTNFLALCTSNLPTPTIVLPGEHFNPVIYTGDNSTNHDISGVGFQPDLTWIKNRSDADSHVLHDAVRGVGEALFSDNQSAEWDGAAYFGPFQTDGFRLSPTTVGSSYNASSENYVSWNWLAATAFSNDASATGIGTNDSSGRVNSTAGFSIVEYTGTGSDMTFKHGLSTTPNMIIFKDRDASTDWFVYHSGIDTAAPNNYYIELNDTAARTSSGWIGVTSTTTRVYSFPNTNTNEYIAYHFHDVEGYSKFGSYVGNGSTDGTFVYTGFRPAYVLAKQTSTTSSWYLYDNKRNPRNQSDSAIWPNGTWAEATNVAYGVDLLSNGFKWRNSESAGGNSSGVTYIYLAFAEFPLKYANAR
jgi:hypothetical protein